MEHAPRFSGVVSEVPEGERAERVPLAHFAGRGDQGLEAASREHRQHAPGLMGGAEARTRVAIDDRPLRDDDSGQLAGVDGLDLVEVPVGETSGGRIEHEVAERAERGRERRRTELIGECRGVCAGVGAGQRDAVGYGQLRDRIGELTEGIGLVAGCDRAGELDEVGATFVGRGDHGVQVAALSVDRSDDHH